MTATSSTRLLPLDESDIDDCVQVELAAYPDNDVQRLLFGKGRALDQAARLVVDAATEQLIAWAAWQFCPERLPDDAGSEASSSRPDWVDSSPITDAFYGPWSDLRRTALGPRPYYTLRMLVTHPGHQRRGAASRLMQWGVDRADEAGVEIYLESSNAGRPLYERFGFQALKTFRFDLAAYGAEGVDEHTAMLRPVQAKGQAV